MTTDGRKPMSENKLGAIDALIAAVAPPPSGGVADVDWTRFEKALGFAAPVDYREIVGRYGVGQFSGEFYVFAPGGSTGQDVYEESATFLDIIGDPTWQESVDALGTQWLHPDGSRTAIDLVGGEAAFQPWGGGSGGGYGYWHTIGDDPNGWPAVYTDLAGVWLYDRDGLASLLLAAVSGRFPADAVHPSVSEEPEFILFESYH
ncbi:hypothetical protein ACQ7HM_20615 [Williamsia sp. MIQD14]|uniref:hypothetical protein n=1 Tax=Williamsia sp. MIQD14 TaxID=3425703 RepID=UPI003DA107B2